jgi:hypothetical protein
MKQLIAIFLSALLILGLAACSSSGTISPNSGSSNPVTPGTPANPNPGTPVTPNPGGAALPSDVASAVPEFPAPADVTSGSLVGTWQISMEFTSAKLAQALGGYLGSQDMDADTLAYTNQLMASVQISPIYVTGTYTFRDDGTVLTVLDRDSATSMVNGMMDWVRQVTVQLMRYQLQKELTNRGIDQTPDDYIADQTGMTMEQYAERMITRLQSSLQEGLEESAAGKTENYLAENGRLYMWPTDETRDSSEYFDFTLQGNQMYLTQYHSSNEEFAEMTAYLVPITMTRIG